MKFIQPYEGGRKLLGDMTAFDLGAGGLKFARYKRVKGALTISHVGIDPNLRSTGLVDKPLALKLPKAALTRQSTLSVSHPSIMTRLVSVPGTAVQQGGVARRIQDQLGLRGELRFSYSMVRPAQGRGNAEFLVAVMPESLVQNALETFRNAPAPMFLEASMLSALKAFQVQVAPKYKDHSVAFMESGADSIFLAVFSRGSLSLVRTFDFGSERLFADIEKRFGLGTAQTRAVVSTGNFDVSESISQVLGRFIDQLNLSRDYIERREGSRLQDLYIAGGLGLSPYVGESIQNITAFNVTSWNPLEGLVQSNRVVPPALEGHETRFASAVGAALNTVEAGE